MTEVRTANSSDSSGVDLHHVLMLLQEHTRCPKGYVEKAKLGATMIIPDLIVLSW